jgi:hypothetical protein
MTSEFRFPRSHGIASRNADGIHALLHDFERRRDCIKKEIGHDFE